MFPPRLRYGFVLQFVNRSSFRFNIIILSAHVCVTTLRENTSARLTMRAFYEHRSKDISYVSAYSHPVGYPFRDLPSGTPC